MPTQYVVLWLACPLADLKYLCRHTAVHIQNTRNILSHPAQVQAFPYKLGERVAGKWGFANRRTGNEEDTKWYEAAGGRHVTKADGTEAYYHFIC